MTITTVSVQSGARTGVLTMRGGRIPMTSNYDEIVRAQIVDAVATNARERVMRADYGADIQSRLFDPSDNLVRTDVANTVKERLSVLVRRARIISVNIDNDPNRLAPYGFTAGGGYNVVLIDVKYAVRLIETSLSVVVPLTESNNG